MSVVADLTLLLGGLKVFPYPTFISGLALCRFPLPIMPLAQAGSHAGNPGPISHPHPRRHHAMSMLFPMYLNSSAAQARWPFLP